jgi:hypothetical protein
MWEVAAEPPDRRAADNFGEEKSHGHPDEG